MPPANPTPHSPVRHTAVHKTPREALARWVTGLTLTTACSQPGMVAGSTKDIADER